MIAGVGGSWELSLPVSSHLALSIDRSFIVHAGRGQAGQAALQDSRLLFRRRLTSGGAPFSKEFGEHGAHRVCCHCRFKGRDELDDRAAPCHESRGYHFEHVEVKRLQPARLSSRVFHSAVTGSSLSRLRRP